MFTCVSSFNARGGAIYSHLQSSMNRLVHWWPLLHANIRKQTAASAAFEKWAEGSSYKQ